jgi:hypothetical protein
MGCVEPAEDLDEPLEAGHRVGLLERLGQLVQAAGLGEVIEDRLDECLATAEAVVDRHPSNPGLTGDGLEAECITALQEALSRIDDPGTGCVHACAALSECVGAGAHVCISAYTVYAVKGERHPEREPRRGTLMTLYAVALFVHIIGSLLLCTAFTAEGIGLIQLRRAAASADVHRWEGVLSLGRVFGPASVVTILASGLYMMISTWGWVPWLAVGLFAWVLVAVLGAVNGVRLSLTLRQIAADASPITRLRSRGFVISWLTRLTIAVGIVFLMTTKPDLAAALLCIVVAAAIGAAAGLALSRGGRPAPTGSAAL